MASPINHSACAFLSQQSQSKQLYLLIISGCEEKEFAVSPANLRVLRSINIDDGKIVFRRDIP